MRQRINKRPFRFPKIQRGLHTIVQRWSSVGLGAKMTAIVTIGILSLLGLFAYLGTSALEENNQRTLQERMVLAQTTARHIDYILGTIEDVMLYTAAQFARLDDRQRIENLADVYQRLNMYATRVFLLDATGRLIAAYPAIYAPVAFDQFAPLRAVFDGQLFVVSPYLLPLDHRTDATLAATPIRNAQNQIIGALAISIDLNKPNLRTFIQPIGLGETGYIDLVDSAGIILASTHEERIGTPSDHNASLATMIREQRPTVSTCHDCYMASATPLVREVLAFAPLERAPWGVAVRQNEAEVFASIRQLQLRIFALMIIMLAGALGLVYVTTRSVIVPVQALTAATHRIAAGDLDTPLGWHGKDEIGILAQAFDAMRLRLKESITEIQNWNRELDARVRERTAACEQAKTEIMQLYQELQRKEQIRRELLNRVLVAQEEERKRISRELHDETCQLLTGLAYALDDAAEAPPSTNLKPQLERMHELTTTALKEIRRMILDLRPTMLDHLGLVPAIGWYADTHLQVWGVRPTIRQNGTPQRLAPPIETALFRVAQEAINNIARHSRATRAELIFEFEPDQLQVWIKDNGKGFDLATVWDANDCQRGLGLMGMEERMSAIGGTLTIHSVPREGTTIHLTVPLDGRMGGGDGKTNSSFGGG